MLLKPVNCEFVIVFTILAGIYVQAVVVIELIALDDIFAKSAALMPSFFNKQFISFFKLVY